MGILTQYEIADSAAHLDGSANNAAINRLYRKQDESHLWPISGAVNATERAIRRLRRVFADTGLEPGLAYALTLDAEIGRLVNSQV